MSEAINDVVAERHRQRDVEMWTDRHDDDHVDFALTEAAVAYASHAAARGWLFDSAPDEYRLDKPFPENKAVFGHGDVTWPKYWSWEWWKPKSPRRDLVRAAALLIAEIERLDRASAGAVPQKGNPCRNVCSLVSVDDDTWQCNECTAQFKFSGVSSTPQKGDAP